MPIWIFPASVWRPQVTPSEFCRDLWQSPRVSYGVCMILNLAIFVQCRLPACDGQYRWTDGQTHDDSMYHSSIASHGNSTEQHTQCSESLCWSSLLLRQSLWLTPTPHCMLSWKVREKTASGFVHRSYICPAAQLRVSRHGHGISLLN